MRNLFDQYQQPENKVTHALLSCLDADRALLQDFILKFRKLRTRGRKLTICEQTLPGDSDLAPEVESDEEIEGRGIPDGCITDGKEWTLLIESKVLAEISSDQLRRHLETAASRELPNVKILVLSVKPPRSALPRNAEVLYWREVYAFLTTRKRQSYWPRACAHFLEVMEAQLVATKQLKEGTLTKFSGIPFGPEEPYNYGQAKRILGLLMDKLLGNKRLVRTLGIDARKSGRAAITGRAGDSVWDYLALKTYVNLKEVQGTLHISISIQSSRMQVHLTLPNGLRKKDRVQILGRDADEFRRRIAKVTHGISKVLPIGSGAQPMVLILQRHYRSQRAHPIVDSELKFNPYTGIDRPARVRETVKLQPQWLDATYKALTSKRSNLQFEIGADFPYSTCPSVRKTEIIDVIEKVALACKPLIDTMKHESRIATRRAKSTGSK